MSKVYHIEPLFIYHAASLPLFFALRYSPTREEHYRSERLKIIERFRNGVFAEELAWVLDKERHNLHYPLSKGDNMVGVSLWGMGIVIV
jgi:hypothetical protein